MSYVGKEIVRKGVAFAEVGNDDLEAGAACNVVREELERWDVRT